MSAVRVWMWTFTITVLQVHVHVFQGVLLSFVASVILSAPPSSSASSWSSSSLEHGSSFPGVYTLKTNGHWQQWKDTHDYKNKSIHNVSRDCVWLHMDVLHIECLFENNEKKNTSHEDPSLCYIHSLIQTPREYEHLMSLIKEEEEEDARSSFSPQLVFNHSLTQEWIEPRLQIKRIHESNNNTTETRRFLNEDGYSYIATRECYLDYEGMMAWIQDYIQEASATGLLKLKWKDIGDSYLKTQNSEKGNDINVLTITGANTNTSTAAPLVLMSSIHAREYAPPELVRRWLLHILEYTQENGRVPPYLETTRIHWFPYVNVDGRLKAETTEPWRRKNMNSDWNSKSDICANDAYGVDLNRNYPFQWGFGDGSSDDACSPFSRGMEPASEPETQAVVNYAAKIFPQSQQEQAFSIQSRTDPKDLPTDWKGYDEATTMGVFVDLHSYGQLFIFPWGHVNNPTPNHNALQAALGKLQYRTGYTAMGPGESFYGAASGATDDAFYGLFGAMGMTWELGVAFHEACEDFDRDLANLIDSLEYLASIAPQPFSLGQGPDIVLATATPSAVQEGESTTLTIEASDSEQQSFDNLVTSSQSVVEVRLYMEHPVVAGNENAVAVGVWNANDNGWTVTDDDGVSLTATVSWQDLILARGAGNHVLYVQALDSDGYWGPVAAIPIKVESREGALPESKSPSSSVPDTAAPSMQPTRTVPAVPNRFSRLPTAPPDESRVSILTDTSEDTLPVDVEGDSERLATSNVSPSSCPRSLTRLAISLAGLALVWTTLRDLFP